METVRRVRKAGREIAKGLQLNGPFNMQFLAKDNDIKVIECNARAARSFPFVSKAVGLNLADAATDIAIGNVPNLQRFNEDELPYVGVKAAMFSFTRLGGADPVLGVEMASTGEVGCIAESFDAALLLAMEAAGNKQPKKGVLVSSGPEKEKLKFLPSARILAKHGVKLYATKGTAEYLNDHGISATALPWQDESPNDLNALSVIKDELVDFVINIPKNSERSELSRGSQIRQAAVRFGSSLLTNMEKANAYIHALDQCGNFLEEHQLNSLPPYKS